MLCLVDLNWIIDLFRHLPTTVYSTRLFCLFSFTTFDCLGLSTTALDHPFSVDGQGNRDFDADTCCIFSSDASFSKGSFTELTCQPFLYCFFLWIILYSWDHNLPGPILVENEATWFAIRSSRKLKLLELLEPGHNESIMHLILAFFFSATRLIS
jgi:hypothetical protein